MRKIMNKLVAVVFATVASVVAATVASTVFAPVAPVALVLAFVYTATTLGGTE